MHDTTDYENLDYYEMCEAWAESPPKIKVYTGCCDSICIEIIAEPEEYSIYEWFEFYVDYSMERWIENREEDPDFVLWDLRDQASAIAECEVEPYISSLETRLQQECHWQPNDHLPDSIRDTLEAELHGLFLEWIFDSWNDYRPRFSDKCNKYYTKSLI